MRFHSGVVSRVDTETFNIYVAIGGDEVEVSQLSPFPSGSALGMGGFRAMPSVGANCVLIEDKNVYYMLGYHNLPTSNGFSGVFKDEDMPLPTMMGGDVMISGYAGNYFMIGEEKFDLIAGISSRITLRGGVINKLSMDVANVKLDNGSGKLEWYLVDNDRSTWVWNTRSGFTSGDYVEERRGSIRIDDTNYKTNIYEHESEIVGVSSVFESRTKDDDGIHRVFEIKDYENNSSYLSRILGQDFLYYSGITNDNSLWEKTLDTSGKLVINSSNEDGEKWSAGILDGDLNSFYGTGRIEIKSDKNVFVTCEKINLGSEEAAEPLVLGQKLLDKLNELIEIFNNHLHNTPSGPSAPASGSGFKITSVQGSEIWSEVSRSD